MKKIMVLLVLAIFMNPVICFSIDSGVDRLKAAKELKKVMNTSENTREAYLEALIKNFPEDQREKVKKLFIENLDFDYFDRMEIEVLASIFIVEELKAMKLLYSSKAGKSALAKFPEFIAKYQYAVRDEMSRFMKIIEKEFN